MTLFWRIKRWPRPCPWLLLPQKHLNCVAAVRIRSQRSICSFQSHFQVGLQLEGYGGFGAGCAVAVRCHDVKWKTILEVQGTRAAPVPPPGSHPSTSQVGSGIYCPGSRHKPQKPVCCWELCFPLHSMLRGMIWPHWILRPRLVPLPHPPHSLRTPRNIPGPVPSSPSVRQGSLSFYRCLHTPGLRGLFSEPPLEQVCLGIIPLHNVDTFPLRNSSQFMTVELLMCLPSTVWFFS